MWLGNTFQSMRQSIYYILLSSTSLNIVVMIAKLFDNWMQILYTLYSLTVFYFKRMCEFFSLVKLLTRNTKSKILWICSFIFHVMTIVLNNFLWFNFLMDQNSRLKPLVSNSCVTSYITFRIGWITFKCTSFQTLRSTRWYENSIAIKSMSSDITFIN